MLWYEPESDNNILPIYSWCNEIEDGAMAQARNLANHPCVRNPVALMPDCHQGYGMPIGGVVAMKDAISPNCVGVDIGCGMRAVKTDIPVLKMFDDKLRMVIARIKKNIPVGEGKVNKDIHDWDGFEYFENYSTPYAVKGKSDILWYKKSLGSLGGGNHFIEIQKGDDGFIWLMIHSGSRKLGHNVCSYYNERAYDFDYLGRPVPNDDLKILSPGTFSGDEYLRDMNFALDYARENRRIMMQIIKIALRGSFSEVNYSEDIDVHHNYVAKELIDGVPLWVHRKGATSAREDEVGIIPGSMGTSSYIVKGKGNPESFYSCSHGAGRAMGRMAACRELNEEECTKSMEGIVFDGWGTTRRRKNSMVDLGEAPGAYKDIEDVMESQNDLVGIQVRLEPLGNVKG